MAIQEVFPLLETKDLEEMDSDIKKAETDSPELNPSIAQHTPHNQCVSRDEILLLLLTRKET